MSAVNDLGFGLVITFWICLAFVMLLVYIFKSDFNKKAVKDGKRYSQLKIYRTIERDYKILYVLGDESYSIEVDKDYYDADIEAMQTIDMPSERAIQDYRSTYNDTRDWLRRDKEGQDKDKSTVDWGDVVFEVDLLKSQEINLDYILELIFDHNKKNKSKEGLIEEVRRMIRGSLGNRAKESLVVDFIHQTNLDEFNDKASIIDAFFKFAQAEQKREADAIIVSEKLNEEAAKRYMASSLKREYASENGTALNEALPKLSPLNPQYRTQKQTVFQKIAAFVEKFKGVGGQL